MPQLLGSLVAILILVGAPVSTAADTGPAQDAGRPAHPGPDALRTGAGPPLTLEAALDEALAHNAELLALRRRFEAARERPARERFLSPPTFEAQIWQWPIDTIDPGDANMYMFMLGQEFPGPGKRRLREALAKTDVQLAAGDVAVRARDVIDRVKRAYADLFLARKSIDVHHASADLLRQLADLAQVKYATGRISQQDVLKAVVELSLIHDHLIGLEEQAALNEARLNTLLDRPPGAPIGPLSDPRERVALPPVEHLQALAIQHQPELATARLRTERAEARLAVVKREYLPDLFAQGGYMLMPGGRDAWMARIGVTWPAAPWARGGLDAQRAEATAEIRAADAEVRAAEAALRLAVRQAYVRVTAAGRRAALLRTTVLPQARQALEVSRVAYQTDRVDFLAIIDNERVRLDAQLDYYGALSTLEQTLAELERAVGTDLALPPTPAQGGLR